MDRSHGGRVEREGDVEDAFVNAIGDAMAEQALPGVFAAGKKIVNSSQWRDEEGTHVLFGFDDGSDIEFVGVFAVRANQGLAVVEERNLSGKAVHHDPKELEPGE